MQWILRFVVYVAFISGVAQGDDDCSGLPQRFMKAAGECCQVPKTPIPTLKTSMRKCFQKHSTPQPPSGPASPEMTNTFLCVIECVFAEEGLLNSENKVDKEALSNYIPSVIVDPELATVAADAIEKCFETYEDEIDPGADCQSGAHLLTKCMVKESFINCPASLWSESEMCEELKEMAVRCS